MARRKRATQSTHRYTQTNQHTPSSGDNTRVGMTSTSRDSIYRLYRYFIKLLLLPDALDVLPVGAAEEDVVEVEVVAAGGEDRPAGPALDVPLAVPDNGVQLAGGDVLPAHVPPVHRAGRAVAPPPVCLPPAPEVFLAPLSAVVATLLAVVSGVGGGRAEVRVPPLAELAGGLVTPVVSTTTI